MKYIKAIIQTIKDIINILMEEDEYLDFYEGVQIEKIKNKCEESAWKNIL
jgi:hypothetical protein